MGFFFDLLKAIGGAIAKKGRECSNKKAEYESKSDDELFRLVRNGSDISRAVAFSLLVDRGYSKEEIKSRIS